jgi:hypothetical protein
LVVALHGAVALAQGRHVAEGVGHDLHLHMAGVFDQALQVHGVVPKALADSLWQART